MYPAAYLTNWLLSTERERGVILVSAPPVKLGLAQNNSNTVVRQ